MDQDQKFLARTLELARRSGIRTSPNPNVGAVITKDGEIIAEGFHAVFGGPHAEVNAVQQVNDASLLRGATLYVSLEPCSYHGKTPPCTELIIRSGIRKVIIGTSDPNPLVNGKGVAEMQAAGIEVSFSSDRKPFDHLIRFFRMNQINNRPWVTLKWAESADRIIGKRNQAGKSGRIQISSEESNGFVHQLRAGRQGIMVGKNTLLQDNPALTSRGTAGPDPVRIVFDPGDEYRNTLRVFDPSGMAIVISGTPKESAGNVRYCYLPVPRTPGLLLKKLLDEFEIGSLMIEGGAALLASFLREELWDECVVIRSPALQNTETAVDPGEVIVAPDLPEGKADQVFRCGPDEIFVWTRSLPESVG